MDWAIIGDYSLQKFHLILHGKTFENFPEHLNYIVLLSKEITNYNTFQKQTLGYMYGYLHNSIRLVNMLCIVSLQSPTKTEVKSEMSQAETFNCTSLLERTDKED